MGRWSRIAGREFVHWLRIPGGLRWLDVGCGTGAFSQVIFDACAPSQLVGIDPSEFQLVEARAQLGNRTATFLAADAMSLPFGEAAFDAAVAGLVLNFVSDPQRMVSEMKRVVGDGGCVAAYVWDFSGGGSVTQHIGIALAEFSPSLAQAPDNVYQVRTTSLDVLASLFIKAGLDFVETRPFEIKLHFESFDDYWSANTTFASPNARQLAALAPNDREIVRQYVRELLSPSIDGTIEYVARTNAVRGSVPC